MKLLQEMEDGPNDRKFIKSQVEKRRRERINRSLECLRTMLLQEPQEQTATQRRVEKAEILEHTVLFLQKTAKQDKTRAGREGRGRRGGGVCGGGGGGGGQKHSFQDGFSTCLQRAAQFLGPEGKGLWLGAALDASFAARFSRSDSDSAGVQRRTEAQSTTSSSCTTSSLPQTKSLLRLLRQKSKHRLSMRACSSNTLVHPYQRLVRKDSPRVPQQPQKQSLLEFRVVSRASKQSPTQSCPLNQTLWRPWP